MLLLHHILMKWCCNPHRTGRKQRKLGFRAVELDEIISIKCRALGHRKGKCFAQSYRGSSTSKLWKLVFRFSVTLLLLQELVSIAAKQSFLSFTVSIIIFLYLLPFCFIFLCNTAKNINQEGSSWYIFTDMPVSGNPICMLCILYSASLQ